MEVICHGKTPRWKSRTLLCPFCGCRFVLNRKDKNELCLIKDLTTKKYKYLVHCPDCQKDFPVGNLDKIKFPT